MKKKIWVDYGSVAGRNGWERVVAEEEVVAELGLSDTLPGQRSDTPCIGEVRLARGGLAHSARREREENERPLDIWKWWGKEKNFFGVPGGEEVVKLGRDVAGAKGTSRNQRQIVVEKKKLSVEKPRQQR